MMKPFHPTVSKVIRLVMVTCLGGLLPTAAVAQTIVWTDVDARRMQEKDVNGGEIRTLVQFQSPPVDFPPPQIHFDPLTAKLYYRWGSAFERANPDGSNPETILTPSVGIFTLNVELRKLYWIEGFSDDVLNRSELDGTGFQSHTYPSCCLLTLEAIGNDLFFGAGVGMQKGIWRADADGTNERYLHVSGQPMDLAYDPTEDKLYLATIDNIYRLNSDGSGFQTIIDGVSNHIAVDYEGRKVYWMPRGNRLIQRANLDGSNVEDFVTYNDVGNPNFDPQGLTIVYNALPLIPATSAWGLMAMIAIVLAAGMFVLKRRFGTQSDG